MYFLKTNTQKNNTKVHYPNKQTDEYQFSSCQLTRQNPLLHGTSPVEQPRSLTSGKYIPQVSSAKKVPDIPAANGDGVDDGYDGYGGHGSMSRWQSLEG